MEKTSVKSVLVTLVALVVAGIMPARADRDINTMQAVNALDLRIINKGWDETSGPYTRLPAEMKDSVRSTLWDCAVCSAGVGVRFATNSTAVGVKYKLLKGFSMPHMAFTGIKGTDLYIHHDGEPQFEGDSGWRHVNTNRPAMTADRKDNDKVYVENMDSTMKEFMIYLPLYDGVEELYVMIDSGAVITPGSEELILPTRRIVAYGTSILQGGCASRAGMASTNMISRSLNAEVINLGFSGEGKMDFEMARAMASIKDVDLYLLDPVPNCTQMMLDTITYDFVKILRTLRPEVPIVMLEGPIYPYARYDSFFNSYLPAKNREFRKNYELLKAENPENLYYVDSVNLDGVEDDGTVDGIHLTDLGFKYYADKLTPIIREILGY
ncbi:MAG: SGNH/GDSL hydrolase family protein [Muribaculaceae bacterium]|nr:SGNH/GDSL hydrolase family protein [Muribaculaceae bacterium]